MLIKQIQNIKFVINKINKFLTKEENNYLIAFEKDKNQMPT